MTPPRLVGRANLSDPRGFGKPDADIMPDLFTTPFRSAAGDTPREAPGWLGDRTLSGWRVSSEIPLPELTPWRGDDRASDLVITSGAVPERLGDLMIDQPQVQVSVDGSCRFAVPGVATYLIDPDGRNVVVDPAIGAAGEDIRLYLFGTVLGILGARRGLLPLHAGCVRFGWGAVAFAGASGMGKSTLAATLIKRGYQILSDDVTLVGTDGTGGVIVHPSLPRLKLCPDAVARLGIPTDMAERVRRDADKFHLPVGDGFHASPLPLTAIFHLRRPVGDEPTSSRRLWGAEALAAIGDDTYRPVLMHWLDREQRLPRASLTLAGIPGGVWSLCYRHGPAGPEEVIEHILGALGHSGGAHPA